MTGREERESRGSQGINIYSRKGGRDCRVGGEGDDVGGGEEGMEGKETSEQQQVGLARFIFSFPPLLSPVASLTAGERERVCVCVSRCV